MRVNQARCYVLPLCGSWRLRCGEQHGTIGIEAPNARLIFKSHFPCRAAACCCRCGRSFPPSRIAKSGFKPTCECQIVSQLTTNGTTEPPILKQCNTKPSVLGIFQTHAVKFKTFSKSFLLLIWTFTVVPITGKTISIKGWAGFASSSTNSNVSPIRAPPPCRNYFLLLLYK